GHVLKFSKRAQLFPMLYHGRAASSQGKLVPIRDPEHFGPIVDYRVPQALRTLGILRYDENLANRIDDGMLIVPESAMEIEIRIATTKATLMLLEAINAIRQEPITMVELDYVLWSMGRAPSFPQSKHHYTYTTAY
ncbi:MAG TPA: queuosine salvage family protein, partial [Patescibacteria group bacterium]|nr:queuosine salvage family protein [Patescibacteria group bacterium]